MAYFYHFQIVDLSKIWLSKVTYLFILEIIIDKLKKFNYDSEKQSEKKLLWMKITRRRQEIPCCTNQKWQELNGY